MAFDLQEQEQIAELKAAWESWGRFVAGAVVIALIGYLGWTGWNWYANKQAQAAGDEYSVFEKAYGVDPTKAGAQADALKKDYPNSPFTTRAALLAAKGAADAGDTKTATDQLTWVIAHSAESAVRDAARMSLAAVELDQKQYDVALKTLSGRENESYTALFAEARGDVLAAKGDAAGARDAYKDALAKLDKSAGNARFVEVKLAALGNS
ncbi:putative negative regulator of RcsB-dependent stress response [Silvimonas terrae]|uniref:Ancillary SecYEG translocon subunit n=1 Tax=Silvimonas terrae TaxID=300266 RepID=A0A840RDC0_9NEIS|nr:tetratricopeptide repeat protein [Silvimonas terrae]MBB5190360.1 putative negative regulator of RcsB-dependent stress response [Silvimonas terrae]